MPIQGTRSLISAMREDPRITAIKEEQRTIAIKEQQRIMAIKEKQRINALKEEQKSNTPPLIDAPLLPGAVPETDHHKVFPGANAATAGPSERNESPVFYMPKRRKERPKKRGPGRGDAMKSHRRQPRPVDPLGSGIWRDLGIDEALDNLPSPPVHRYHENRKNVADNCPSPDDSWSLGSDWSLDDNSTDSEKDEPAFEKKTFLVSPVEHGHGPVYSDVQVTRPGTSHHTTFIDNGRVVPSSETSPEVPLRKRFMSYLRYLKWKLFH